jgi:hypothetical protein
LVRPESVPGVLKMRKTITLTTGKILKNKIKLFLTTGGFFVYGSGFRSRPLNKKTKKEKRSGNLCRTGVSGKI